jgi:hypothetical protein
MRITIQPVSIITIITGLGELTGTVTGPGIVHTILIAIK